MDETLPPSSPGADEAAWLGLIESFRGPSATGRGPVETTPTAAASTSSRDPRDEPTGATASTAEPVESALPDLADSSKTDSPKPEDERWMSLFEEAPANAEAEPTTEQPEPASSLLPPAPAPAELGAGWRQYTPAEAPVDHFVPPVPPPLPETDAITRGAWLGVIGGPLLILLAALFNRPLSGWLLYLALGGFVGGFCLLVWRMRDRDPFDDDNGAVV